MTALLTLEEVADELRLPADWDRIRWVKTRIARGELRATRLTGRLTMVSRRQLDRYIAQRETVELVKESAPEPQPATLLGLSKRSQDRVRSA